MTGSVEFERSVAIWRKEELSSAGISDSLMKPLSGSYVAIDDIEVIPKFLELLVGAKTDRNIFTDRNSEKFKITTFSDFVKKQPKITTCNGRN